MEATEEILPRRVLLDKLATDANSDTLIYGNEDDCIKVILE